MGKKALKRVLAEHEAKAIGRGIRISPRKLNLVAQVIRGKSAEKALNELTFSPKRIAGDVKKVLQSAIANAENNHDLDVDDLVVTEASVGKNLVMKRFQARARGRGAEIQKPFSQITIVVAEKSKLKPVVKAKAEAETAAAEKPAGKKKKAPVTKKKAPAKSKTAKSKSAPKSDEEKA
jgi:large subunit ribosomal protein L22